MKLILLTTLAFMLFIDGGAHAWGVNMHSIWNLPRRGFPVFYRHFKDHISWVEADAVCQFHHARLVTVDNDDQFEMVNGYLRDLQIHDFVWTGLKRADTEPTFFWSDMKPLSNEGYWVPNWKPSPNVTCAAADPRQGFRWRSLDCNYLDSASFVCEMEVPEWASRKGGCILDGIPSLSVTFIPEEGAIQLTNKCGESGYRRVTCKSRADSEKKLRRILDCNEKYNGTDNQIKNREPFKLVYKPEPGFELPETPVQRKSILLQDNVDTQPPTPLALPKEMSIAEEPFSTRSNINISTLNSSELYDQERIGSVEQNDTVDINPELTFIEKKSERSWDGEVLCVAQEAGESTQAVNYTANSRVKCALEGYSSSSANSTSENLDNDQTELIGTIGNLSNSTEGFENFTTITPSVYQMDQANNATEYVFNTKTENVTTETVENSTTALPEKTSVGYSATTTTKRGLGIVDRTTESFGNITIENYGKSTTDIFGNSSTTDVSTPTGTTTIGTTSQIPIKTTTEIFENLPTPQNFSTGLLANLTTLAAQIVTTSSKSVSQNQSFTNPSTAGSEVAIPITTATPPVTRNYDIPPNFVLTPQFFMLKEVEKNGTDNVTTDGSPTANTDAYSTNRTDVGITTAETVVFTTDATKPSTIAVEHVESSTPNMFAERKIATRKRRVINTERHSVYPYMLGRIMG